MPHSAANSGPGASAPACQFATTHWSMVVAAGHGRSPESEAALEALCRDYWYPLYVYVRRRGYSADDAQDLTQAFFAALLEKKYLRDAERTRGRFRTFLLTAMQRFLSKEQDRQRSQKRGGGRRAIALDFPAGEDRYRHEPSHSWTPERLYERRWALTLLDNVLQEIEIECKSRGKQDLFEELKQYLAAGPQGQAYGQTAVRLGISEGAVKVAVHRLRRSYREILRREVSKTLAAGEDLADELRQLQAAVRGESGEML